jgi:hypothetical protein
MERVARADGFVTFQDQGKHIKYFWADLNDSNLAPAQKGIQN